MPSAPLPKALIIRSSPTLPVHGTKTVRNEVGYCARIVPAISAPPYPHFRHKNAKILISSSVIISPLFNPQLVIIHQYKPYIEYLYSVLVL